MDLGIPKSAPTIGPTLCAKIMGLQFYVANIDDLKEGMHPFSVRSRGTVCILSVLVVAAPLRAVDINTFQNADKVFMPTNLFHVASALRQYIEYSCTCCSRALTRSPWSSAVSGSPGPKRKPT
jgi:hypothetical protein